VWSNELKYLGITILSGMNFKINMQPSRQKCLGAVNGTYGKVGLNTSPPLLVSLINSFCIPIILYGLVAVTPNNKINKTINTAFSLAFSKIFSTFDTSIIEQCQYYLGVFPLSRTLEFNKFNLLGKISNGKNYHILTLFNLFVKDELLALRLKYTVLPPEHRYIIRTKMNAVFKQAYRCFSFYKFLFLMFTSMGS